MARNSRSHDTLPCFEAWSAPTVTFGVTKLEGDDVVEGNDGIGWIAHAHKLVDGLLGKIVADVATLHKIAVDGDIMLAQRL